MEETGLPAKIEFPDGTKKVVDLSERPAEGKELVGENLESGWIAENVFVSAGALRDDEYIFVVIASRAA
jgi:hypothetical protein